MSTELPEIIPNDTDTQQAIADRIDTIVYPNGGKPVSPDLSDEECRAQCDELRQLYAEAEAAFNAVIDDWARTNGRPIWT